MLTDHGSTYELDIAKREYQYESNKMKEKIIELMHQELNEK